MKSKKKLLGRYKSERESKWEPLGDLKEDHLRVMKKMWVKKTPFDTKIRMSDGSDVWKEIDAN